MPKTSVQTSTDYERPYRPALVSLLNKFGRSLRDRGIVKPLSVDALLSTALRATRIEKFDDMTFVQALSVLVDSINNEANLNFVGHLIQQAQLQRTLLNRLRIQEYLKTHGEVSASNLGKVILIAGLQRTGTTTLQRLIASHPRVRGVTLMDALDPVSQKAGSALRSLRGRAIDLVLSYLSPHFSAIHPTGSDVPEEDVLLLDLCFMSQSPEALMHVPTYAAWLEKQDHVDTYEYFLTVLKILNSHQPSEVWVLKSPHHMGYLDTFLRTFPNATIVQTHRDPRKTMPSFCSMVCHNRGVFSDVVRPREVASHWTRKVQKMVQNSIEVRARHNSAQFIDVAYYDLVRDPIGVLEKIYRTAGVEFSAEAQCMARDLEQQNPQNKFGKHIYHLSDFGFTAESIDESFSSYRALYEIPIES